MSKPPQVVHGDCVEIMKMLPNDSIDSIVTDPPYGLGFMGKAWDALPPGQDWAEECLRVLKPGGHLLAFGGTRTWHRLAVAVEDAGFEIRDSIAWMYGSGFPKSLDISKAIDKENGRKFEDRFALGRHIRERRIAHGLSASDVNAWFGYRDGCQHWERQDRSGARVPNLQDYAVLEDRLGLSSEYLPLVARIEAERVILSERPAYGIGGGGILSGHAAGAVAKVSTPANAAAQKWNGWGTALKPAFEPIVTGRKPLAGTVATNVLEFGTGAFNISASRHGDRWPNNVILDESQAERFAESRYFYTAKPSKTERPVVDGVAHTTVKPLALMRWLVTLVTPPGGTVLEPFAGSGTTVEACILEGFHCIAIEREAEYIPLIQARIDRQDAA